jgi:putative membrane protein
VGAVAAGIHGREGGRSTLAPVLPSSAVEALVRAVDPEAPSPGDSLEPHPRAALPRRFVRALPLPLAATLAAAALGWWWVAAAGALATTVAVPVALDRYRQLGHCFDGRRLAIRGGCLLRRWTTVDPSAVVSYEVRRSPGQARAGLCSVHLHLGQGAGSRRVLDLGEEQARTLLAALDPPLLEPLVAAAA